MDFMLMMGVAGTGVNADHVDTLDLFHTMEAYFTWYPKGRMRVSSTCWTSSSSPSTAIQSWSSATAGSAGRSPGGNGRWPTRS